jgi:SMODS and SLOG-associating 2TM effector domain 2
MTLAELDAAYAAAVKDVENEIDWYARRRWRWVFLSWLTRGLGAVALVVGVILPLSKELPFNDFFSSPAQAAIACIALAGLAVGADQVFMISATWARYVSAMTKIETLQRAIKFDWIALRAGLADPISLQDVQRALALFKALVIGSRQIVEAETNSWSAELVKAVEQLRVLISEQKTAVDTLSKEGQRTREVAHKLAVASTLGTVRVKIEGAVERLVGSVRVTIAGHSEDRNAPVTTIVVPEILYGTHTVTLAGCDTAGNPVTVEDVVQVVSNSIADISLPIREATNRPSAPS